MIKPTKGRLIFWVKKIQARPAVIKVGTSKLIVDWRDPRQVQAAFTPTDKRPHDQKIYCYRPNGKLYAVVPPRKWKRLREQEKLNSFLDKQRRSGSIND